ncbi:hypothetical protein DQ04_18111010 [Trypanosoma grayi]|uniref:hypothetical protein n=1 Tax=Trypanosoma grayi TaxID=71804 RepID=UPI0004F45D82|nr:hypothetical protein DQ04_18111010 [Trypanosoma grayi]KEG05825.1 hypothetical protein DQ04_18111010 [Trypanosoma grayi]
MARPPRGSSGVVVGGGGGNNSSGSCSEVVPRPTALEILDQLPNSVGLVTRQRPLPLGKPPQPAGFGFHAVAKKNKLFGS